MDTISMFVSSRKLLNSIERRRIGQIPHDENGEFRMMKMRNSPDEFGLFYGSSALLV
jgi:hypothetical protein